MRAMEAAGFQDVRGIDICPAYRDAKNVMIGDAGELVSRSADGTLGAIVALDVFEHIPLPDLKELLKACAAKLAAGGRIVFRVPNAGTALGCVCI